MFKIVRRFLLALTFLTVLPLPCLFSPNNSDHDNNIDQELSKSSVFFPFAGFLIGIILFLTTKILKYFVFPSYLVAVFVLLVWVFLSGGLHLEGLADMVDGFPIGKSKEMCSHYERGLNRSERRNCLIFLPVKYFSTQYS